MSGILLPVAPPKHNRADVWWQAASAAGRDLRGDLADQRADHGFDLPGDTGLVPARIGNVAFDCDDVLKVAAFWSEVLGRPVDGGSSEFFASIGGRDADRAEPALYFNKVPETKHVKNRVHLDLVDPDPRAVQKLVRIGATVVGRHRISGQSWTVMQDVEGNEFCVAAKSYTG